MTKIECVNADETDVFVEKIPKNFVNETLTLLGAILIVVAALEVSFSLYAWLHDSLSLGLLSRLTVICSLLSLFAFLLGIVMLYCNPYSSYTYPSTLLVCLSIDRSIIELRTISGETIVSLNICESQLISGRLINASWPSASKWRYRFISNPLDSFFSFKKCLLIKSFDTNKQQSRCVQIPVGLSIYHRILWTRIFTPVLVQPASSDHVAIQLCSRPTAAQRAENGGCDTVVVQGVSPDLKTSESEPDSSKIDPKKGLENEKAAVHQSEK